MKRGLCLCYLIFGFIIFSLTQQGRFNEGEKYFNQGNYSKAMSIFREIYQRKTKDELTAKSALRLGQCYLAFKSYENARQFFKEAHKWGGAIADEAQMGIALTYLGEKKYDIAIENLTSLISQSYREEILAYSHYNRALCYEGKNWIKKAMEDLQEARKRAKKDDNLLQAIKEELKKCESLYKEFQEKENSYLQKIKADEAFGDYESCAGSLRELARLCEDWGEMDKAIDYELQAIEYSQSEEFRAGSLMNIAWRYCKEKKYEASAKTFKKVVDEYPYSQYAAEALLRAGDMYSSAGKNEEAMRCYQEFLEKFPNDEKASTVMLNLAWALFGKGEESSMESLFEKVAKSFPQTEIGYFALGYLNELRGKYKEAIEAYKKCQDYNGAYYFLATNGIGVCLYNMGKSDDIASLRECFKVYASLLRREDTPEPIKQQAMYLATLASLNPRLDRNLGYKQLWEIKDLLLEDEGSFLPYLMKTQVYLALSRCYLQIGELEKAVELWSSGIPYVIPNVSPSIDFLHLLSSKFSPIVQQSNIFSKYGGNIDKCSFASIESFFFPKGRDYPEVYVIYGTHRDSQWKSFYESVVKEMISSDTFITYPEDKIKVMKDEEATDEDLKKANLLLIGSLSDNSVIEKIRDSLPIKLGDKFVEIRERRYEGDAIFLIMNVPSPFNKEKQVLIIWSTNPAISSKQMKGLFGWPLNYVISKGGFPSKEESILEAGFFYECPDGKLEAF
ncbi:tetratricopeptide repeat protein [bacterium]|nr:tetratricopeptide repeat protein [bacterium]